MNYEDVDNIPWSPLCTHIGADPKADIHSCFMNQPHELGQVVPPVKIILKGHITSLKFWSMSTIASSTLFGKHKQSEVPIASSRMFMHFNSQVTWSKGICSSNQVKMHFKAILQLEKISAFNMTEIVNKNIEALCIQNFHIFYTKLSCQMPTTPLLGSCPLQNT